MAYAPGLAALGAPSLARKPKRQPSQPPTGPGAAGLGAFAPLAETQRPRPPAISPGIRSAGSALAPAPPRINPGIGQAGGALLGKSGGGGGGAGPGAAATSAPPPAAPTPAQTFNIPLDPGDEQSKAAAQATYDTSTGSYLRGLQGAAEAYGDPSIMAGLGLGTTVNPNSALALAALKAQQDQQASGNTREQAGTFFSSLHDQDLSDIASAQQRAQLAGYTTYQGALGDYNTNMATALNALNNALNTANIDERAKAIATLPTAANVGQGPLPPPPSNPAGSGAGAQAPNTLPPGVTVGNVPSTLGGKTIGQWWGAGSPTADWTMGNTGASKGGGGLGALGRVGGAVLPKRGKK